MFRIITLAFVFVCFLLSLCLEARIATHVFREVRQVVIIGRNITRSRRGCPVLWCVVKNGRRSFRLAKFRKIGSWDVERRFSRLI